MKKLNIAFVGFNFGDAFDSIYKDFSDARPTRKLKSEDHSLKPGPRFRDKSNKAIKQCTWG